jgi:CRP-like cAMP-binding protein
LARFVVEKRFFEFLSHDERVDCLCLGDLVKYPAGTTLVRKGDPPCALRVLLFGEAEVRVGATVLNQMGVGEVFGEISFILAAPASADVVAKTDVSVLEISMETSRRLFKQRPSVAAALYRSLAAELARRLVRISGRVVG